MSKNHKTGQSSVFTRYMDFIESYKGHATIGKNDARAYISAMADIIALDSGAKNVEDILYCLDEAIINHNGNPLEYDQFKKTIEEWRCLDRTPLINAIKKSPARISLPKSDKKNGLQVISLFTGNYGLDLGFEYAGLNSRVALDIDPASEEIVKANRPKLPFILGSISHTSTEEILNQAGLKKGEVDILIGGPPCQPFSTAGKRQSFNDPRGSPLKEFIRVINEAQPRAFVMEEVKGLLNARLMHVPWHDRKKELKPDEELGSVWDVVIDMLNKTGYRIDTKVHNAADFGTPQIRERVIVMGIRPDLRRQPVMPDPTHVKPTLIHKKLPIWNSLIDALASVPSGEFMNAPPKYKKYIKFVPPGGNWRQIPLEYLPEAMNRAYTSEGGRTGFYRRLSLFEPAPTLVTTPIMKGSMLIHPVEDRPLSINEYKVIQGFPVDWKLPGTISNGYKKMGESVPPYLAYSIAVSLKQILSDTDNSPHSKSEDLASWGIT